MPVSQGRFARLALSFDGGLTYSDAARVVDVTVNEETEEVDFTSHDSVGHREFQPGLSSSTLDYNVIYDSSDPGYVALENAHIAKSTFQFRFRVLGDGSGLPQRIGTGFITSFTTGAPLDGMATVDISLRVSGAIQNSLQ